MSTWQRIATDPPVWLRGARRLWTRWVVVAAALLALVLALVLPATGARSAGAPAHAGQRGASGAGKTIIEGGNGGNPLIPVTTLVAFHATAQGGNFECLALAPPAATGPGSGEFTVNVMYVTGSVSSMELAGDSAILHGTATVTGIGAGQNVPFTAQVTAGGPGATVVLTVSPPSGALTFHETLVEGHINVG